MNSLSPRRDERSERAKEGEASSSLISSTHHPPFYSTMAVTFDALPIFNTAFTQLQATSNDTSSSRPGSARKITLRPPPPRQPFLPPPSSPSSSFLVDLSDTLYLSRISFSLSISSLFYSSTHSPAIDLPPPLANSSHLDLVPSHPPPPAQAPRLP